jgi:hypothetical protein
MAMAGTAAEAATAQSPWRVAIDASAPPAPASLEAAGQTPLHFSFARTYHGKADEQASAWRASGVTRTAVDHSFGSEDATGSAGFLCGLQSPVNASGSAEARGADPQGRFLGAKLVLPFH